MGKRREARPDDGRDHADERFSGTDLVETVIAAGVFRRCAFVGVRFNCARLSEADDGADFTGADLRGSVLTAFDPRIVELRGAIITPDQAVDLALSLQLDLRPGAV